MFEGKLFNDISSARVHGCAIEVEIFDPAIGVTMTAALACARPLPLWQVAILAGCILPIGYSGKEYTCMKTGKMVTVTSGWKKAYAKAA